MFLSSFPHRSYINGQWRKCEPAIAVFNPYDESILTHVDNSGIEVAEAAIAAAKGAFLTWSAMCAHQRYQILRKWHDLILENQQELAEILTLEQGKSLAEAKGEIAYSASFILWFAEEAKRVYGDIIPSPNAEQQLMVIKQAVGVVTAITPWNFPSAMITRKAAAALSAGCTFVVKPDIQTPLSALALAKMADSAGIPPGVFNVVVSDKAQEVGQVLTQHPDVAKFTFTGSTETGKKLLSQCAKGIKRTSMELGGNAPLIVFEDADIKAAVAGAIASKYRNAGQTCISANRIFVHESIIEEFSDQFVDQVKQLNIGSGLDENVDIGPLINKEAVNNVNRLVKGALAEGAKLLLGGNSSDLGPLFYQPTVISNVRYNMDIAQQEIFGPVTTILSFTDEVQVLNMANDTEAGLAAYFYTQNMSRCWRFAKGLQYGMLGINETAISNAYAPFGGVKQSGFGREGSKYGLDDYLDIKYLCIKQ